MARLPAKLPTLRVSKVVVSKLLGTDQREWLPAATTDAILQAYDTPLALGRRLPHPGDAVAAAHELGFTVVLKAEADGLLGKGEPRAVRTGLRSGGEVFVAASDLQRRLGKKFGGFTLQVQAHAEGHREMLLGRFCGAPAADFDAAYDALLRLQRLVDVPQIAEVEVNRFILAKKGALSVTVDRRMRVEL